MASFTVEGEEALDRDVKPFGSGGAHITIPKRWLGADVKVIRTTEPTDTEE